MDGTGGRGHAIRPFAGGIRCAARSGGLAPPRSPPSSISSARRVSSRSSLERCSTERTGHTPRLARIQAHMQFVRDCDHAAYSMRSQELAYLANTIMAGCSIQARPFTAQEASDAAVAVCNLGLENWPRSLAPASREFLRAGGAARRLSRRSRPRQRVPGRVDGPASRTSACTRQSD